MQELEKIFEEIEAEHPYKVPGNYDSYSQYNEAWQDAIDRVRARLEEFFQEKDNDGWVTVEDRTPEESGYYRVTVKNKELGDITEETAWFAYVDDYDMDESEWRELYEYEEVIAWRELAPYNPERRSDEKE